MDQKTKHKTSRKYLKYNNNKKILHIKMGAANKAILTGELKL